MGLSIPHLLILLAVVAVVFGTKKLRNVGEDIGQAIKGFKKGMQDDDSPAQLKADPLAEQPKPSTNESKSEQTH